MVPGINHSSIFSGYGNLLTTSCSAILGGANNTDNGYACTGIFGANILPHPLLTPLVSGLGGFYVNEMTLQNAYLVPSGGCYLLCVKPGQTYTDIAPGTGYLSSQLYIQ